MKGYKYKAVFIPSADGYRIERTNDVGYVAFYLGRPNDTWRGAPIHCTRFFKSKAEAEFIIRGFT